MAKRLILLLKLAIMAVAAVLISCSLNTVRFLAHASALSWFIFVGGGVIVLLQDALMVARWRRIAAFFADSRISFTTSYTCRPVGESASIGFLKRA